ncbi:PaaI family thioesterase [Lacrimispora sp.]|uniref:PaaI family thioesterase n=3 Tax=Lacrimispora sp. TaxID=2719234 RepID=UPI0028A11CEC|nr:PaaI family thioesterase [Lacrimispora sp.]
MREEIMEGIRRHILPLSGLEKAKLLEVWPGHSKISIEIPESALNLYGNLHGGFLFSLCDITAGMATYAYEYSNVTQHGSLDFMRGIKAGLIYVEANSIHKGSRSVVNRVEVKSEDGKIIAAGDFTMYLLEAL